MSLYAGILAALLALPTYTEDRAPELADAKRSQLEAVATYVAAEAKLQKVASRVDWAALMLAIASHESGFSLRIHAGNCKPHECDRGKARGLWQLHAYTEAATHWERMHGLEHIELQARVASITLIRGFYTCRGKTDWLIGTVNGFAGKKCDAIWPGLDSRVATWRRLRTVIERESSRKAAS